MVDVSGTVLVVVAVMVVVVVVVVLATTYVSSMLSLAWHGLVALVALQLSLGRQFDKWVREKDRAGRQR